MRIQMGAETHTHPPSTKLHLAPQFFALAKSHFFLLMLKEKQLHPAACLMVRSFLSFVDCSETGKKIMNEACYLHKYKACEKGSPDGVQEPRTAPDQIFFSISPKLYLHRSVLTFWSNELITHLFLIGNVNCTSSILNNNENELS